MADIRDRAKASIERGTDFLLTEHRTDPGPERRRENIHEATVVPQTPQTSNCLRFHRAIGTKNSVNCLNSRIRVHCVVLWQRGHVRTSPAPMNFCLVARPKSKNSTTPE